MHTHIFHRKICRNSNVNNLVASNVFESFGCYFICWFFHSQNDLQNKEREREKKKQTTTATTIVAMSFSRKYSGIIFHPENGFFLCCFTFSVNSKCNWILNSSNERTNKREMKSNKQVKQNDTHETKISNAISPYHPFQCDFINNTHKLYVTDGLLDMAYEFYMIIGPMDFGFILPKMPKMLRMLVCICIICSSLFVSLFGPMPAIDTLFAHLTFRVRFFNRVHSILPLIFSLDSRHDSHPASVISFATYFGLKHFWHENSQKLSWKSFLLIFHVVLVLIHLRIVMFELKLNSQ